MAIDIFEYLKHLDQERYRAIILHTAPEKGIALTRFVIRVSEKAKGKYIDLLNLFIKTKELSENIESYEPENLRNFLIEESRAQSLIIIDRADFILDTWRKKERLGFYQMINDQWDGYKERMKAKLVICLQTSSEFESLQIKDSQGKRRILRFEDFNEIIAGSD